MEKSQPRIACGHAGEVAGGRVTGIAFALAVKIGRAGFRVARDYVVDHEYRRSAQRVVDPLVDEMRKLRDLDGGEACTRRAALARRG